MSERPPQTLANHARFVPAYHFFTASLLLINLAWSVRAALRNPQGESLVALGLGVALVLMFLYARNFALTVQDRVIRLEERLRMERLLPADLKGRIDELRPGQFVALRFASDAELAELTRRVLAGELAGAGSIKKAIRSWRADHLRA